jgi:hypothetical protein
VAEQVLVLADQIGANAMAEHAAARHQGNAFEPAKEHYLVGEGLRDEVPHHEAQRTDAYELELRHSVVRHPQ